MVRPTLLAATAVFFAVTGSSPALSGLCEDILKDEIAREGDNLAATVLSIFGGVPTDKIPKSRLKGTSETFVTITEGTAHTLDCDRDIVRSVYFPLGVMLRPLRDVDRHGIAYTIFQSEYGLQLLIDQRAVAPVTDEDLYIFSDNADTHPLCAATRENCSPRRIATEPNNEAWPFVHARWSYLHLLRTPETDRILDAVQRKQGLNAGGGSETAPWKRPWENPANGANEAAGPEAHCAPLSGMLYNFGVPPKPHGGSSAYPYLRFELSACVEPPLDLLPPGMKEAPVALRQVKLVTAAAAEARFDGLWSATMFKSLGSVSTLLEEALNLTHPFTSRKDCSEKATRSSFMTIGASADLKIWDVGGVFKNEIKAQLEQTFSEDKQYVVRSYLHHADADGVAGSTRWPPFFDVQLIARCEGDRAVEPEKIEIDSPLTWKPIELFVDVLDDHYDTVAGGPLGRPSDRLQRTRLDAGYIFVIGEFNEYFYWRDVLRAEFAVNSVLNDIEPSFKVSRKVLTDFFAHLVMSAALQSKVSTKLAPTS